MKRQHRTKLAVEPLERRDLLATGEFFFPGMYDPLNPPGGNVTAEVVDGTLVVRGDGADNKIQVHNLGNGTVILEGLNGYTTVNGQATQLHVCEPDYVSLSGVTRGIDIDLDDGDDILWLKGRGLPDVSIATGNGADYVALGGYPPQYGCVITHSIKFPGPATLLGNLTIDTGDGDDLVHPFAVVKGNAEIRTGPGADRIVQPETVVLYGPIHQDLQVVGTTLVDLGPDPAGSGDSAPENLGRFLTGTSVRMIGGDVISWDKPWYPKFDSKVIDSFIVLDGARSRVAAQPIGISFTFDDIDVLGWPEPLLRSDGTILLDIAYSPTDPAFVDRLDAIGITPHATDEAGDHVSAWITVQQLHALQDVDGLEHVSLQPSALVGPVMTPPPVRYDVNGDGGVHPNDVLMIINAINVGNDVPLAERTDIPAGARVDVNQDGILAPNDALDVINFINDAKRSTLPQAFPAATAEGEGASLSDSDLLALAADEIYRDLAVPRRGRAR